MQRQPSTRRVCIAAAVLALAPLAACSESAKAPRTATVTAPSTTAPTTTAPSTTAPSTTAPSTTAPTTTQPPKPELKLTYAHAFTPAEKKVAEGYFTAAQAFLTNASRPTELSPAIAQTHSAPMLEVVQQQLRSLATRGFAVRLPRPSQTSVTVTAVTVHGDRARLRLCTIDDGIVYNVSTGKAVNADRKAFRQQAVLTRAHRLWKLSERSTLQQEPGEQSCRR